MVATASNLTDVVPPTINHAVGGPFRLLQEYLTFYWAEKGNGRRASFGPLIFFSPVPGMGKHLASIIVAKELGLRYWEILPHDLAITHEREDLRGLIETAADYVLYFNCGRSPPTPLSEDLIVQMIMDDPAALYDHPCDEPKGENTWSERVVILGTERAEWVERFHGRVRLIRFSEYPPEELRHIYADKLRMAGWRMEDEAMRQLVELSGGIVGNGIRHLETAYLLAKNRGEAAIAAAHIQEAHDLLVAHDYAPLPPKV